MARWPSVAGAIVVIALAAVLAGCSTVTAPPGPTTAQLPTIISRAQGYGTDGYSTYNVSFVRFISTSEWPTVMTNCLEAQGITTVDFRLMQPGPYSYPIDPHGSSELSRGLAACALEYPSQDLAGTLRTRAQWNYQYSYLVTDFTACVRAAGGSVSGLPTRKDFLASAVTTTSIPSPYTYVYGVPTGVRLTLVKSRCPAIAPGL